MVVAAVQEFRNCNYLLKQFLYFGPHTGGCWIPCASFGEGGRQSKEETVPHTARNKAQHCLRHDGTGWDTRDIHQHPLFSRLQGFYMFMTSWCQNQFLQSFSFPSHLELLLPRHSPADFQHLHISEGLCFTPCSQADSFSKLRVMQRVGTSTALIKVKMKNPFLGFLWEYTRWCHGCLLRQCVITFLVLPEKLKKATWVLLYHLPPLFSLMLPVTHLDAVLEVPLCSVDVTPITPLCFFSFSFPPQMLLDCLLYIYIMTKRKKTLPSPKTQSMNLHLILNILSQMELLCILLSVNRTEWTRLKIDLPFKATMV